MQNWVNSMKKAGWVKLCFHPFLNPLFLSSVLSCPCTYMYACTHVRAHTHTHTHTHVWKKCVPFYYRFHLKLIVLETGEPRSDKIAKLPDNLPRKSDIFFCFCFLFLFKIWPQKISVIPFHTCEVLYNLLLILYHIWSLAFNSSFIFEKWNSQSWNALSDTKNNKNSKNGQTQNSSEI